MFISSIRYVLSYYLLTGCFKSLYLCPGRSEIVTVKGVQKLLLYRVLKLLLYRVFWNDNFKDYSKNMVKQGILKIIALPGN